MNYQAAAPSRPRRQRPSAASSCLVLSALLLPGACGGGGGGGGGGGSPDQLEAGLRRLGVDTTSTPRESAPGVLLDSDTSPLGTRPVLARTDELLLLNIGLPPGDYQDAPLRLFEVTDAAGAATADVLYGQDLGQVPFLTYPGNLATGPTYTSVAADVDGNGLEDMLFVYQDGIETRLRRDADQLSGYASTDQQIDSNADVSFVTAVAVDLDLDGRDEVVVGVTTAGVGRITAWRFDGSIWSRIGGERLVTPTLSAATLWLQLAAGNVDDDGEPELAVAVQELGGGTGAARSLVLDDYRSSFATLRDEEFNVRDQNSTLRVSLTASVALGDVDGDGRDELLLAGLTELSTGCNSTQQVFAAYDDGSAQFAELGTFYTTYFYPGCNSPSNRRVRTIHLNALDIDGDGRDEVAANQFVYEDFVDAAPWTENAALKLPDDTVWDQNAFGFFDRTTSSFVVGNFDGDTREDLAVFRQDRNKVRIYGLPQTASSTQELRSLDVSFSNSQDRHMPLLVAVNVDTDSPVLSYSAAEYRLVFSEPIVLAALAAPPTRDGIGQNVGGSFTAFGNTTSSSAASERSVTFSAGVTAGVNLDGGALTQSEFELKGTLTTAATVTQGRAYELSQTIVFSTAPREDTVVFTTVPIDRYTYTILSHPDPALVGDQVVVDYPRTPVTLQAERSFYNSSIPAGAQRVDESVFQHTVGDPTTYPSIAEKNAIRSSRGGLEVGPQAVGQGAGTTEVTLQVGTAISSGGSLAVGFELDVETTAGGVLVGTSVGVESTSTWRVESGSSTTYTGVIGAIDAANFAGNRYSFGLFTYTLRPVGGRQQFQVLNYWVE